MNRIFELYDDIVLQHVSYHKTLEGALAAMSQAIDKIAPGLCRDYEEDDRVDFSIKYSVKTHKVKE